LVFLTDLTTIRFIIIITIGLILFGIQHGAAIYTIHTIGHTITVIGLMVQTIIIIHITSTMIREQEDSEVPEDILQGITMVEEDQSEQGLEQVLQGAFINLQEPLIPELRDQQLPQEAEHIQIAEPDREVETQ
jgi:hypothetical protein